jgi:hypothetical protein
LGLGLGGAALNEEGFSPVHALVLEPSAKFSPEWTRNHGNCARCEELGHVSLILRYLCGIIGPHGAMSHLSVRADTEDLLSMMIRVRLVRPKDSA